MEKREFSKIVSPEDLPVETKLKAINSTSSLEELKTINSGYLPPVPLIKPDNYYFISYSHKDYKKVYADIYALQARGVNIWYDRGMRAGSDWKEVADEFITPSRCAGVIFYVSENSLVSDAIHTEIEFAKKCGKSALTVNLPVESDYFYNGESVKGKDFSAKKLLDILKANGKEIGDGKYKAISEAFGDDVIYVKYTESAAEKTEKILSMKRPPLVDAGRSEMSKSDTYATCGLPSYRIVSVNDHDIRRFEESDYLKARIIDGDGEGYSLFNIDELGSCAFADCRRLESVFIPEHIDTINEFAFYGCNALKEINFGGDGQYHRIYEVRDGAFYDCFALESFDLSDVCEPIGHHAFYRCRSLKKLTLCEDLRFIRQYAFAYCENLEEIDMNKILEVVGDCAFKNCKKLKAITLPDTLDMIGYEAFNHCESLESIEVPESVTRLGGREFDYCKNLKRAVVKCKDMPTFRHCENLGEIVFTQPHETIHAGAFEGCTRLKAIDLKGTEFVRADAFKDCESLKRVEFSSDLKALTDKCFFGCKSLEEIVYGGTLKDWASLPWTTEDKLKYGDELGMSLLIADEDMLRSRYDERQEKFDCFRYLGLGDAPTVIRCTDGEIVNPEYRLKLLDEKLAKWNKTGICLGTERTRALLDGLGSPDKCLKIVHIAGSNGKGSVASYISNILKENGVKVGLFTSPYVFDFRECFRIDGAKVDFKLLFESFDDVFALDAAKDATRFEIETAAAINAFKRAGCEYAVLECGMGGLGDATNAVAHKELAVITSVSLEHTQWLGKTVKEICANKAGIIRDCPAIVGAYNTDEVKDYFKALGAVIADEPQDIESYGESGSFTYNGKSYLLSQYSCAQPYNAVLAIQAVNMLGLDGNKRRAFDGFSGSYLVGRLQHIYGRNSLNGKTFILDGAHNPASFVPLAELLESYREKYGKPYIIYGCLSDKDIGGCLEKLEGLTDTIAAVRSPSPRAMDYGKICAECERHFKNVIRAESVSAALDTADGELVVVCGSFTVLKEAREWIEKRL